MYAAEILDAFAYQPTISLRIEPSVNTLTVKGHLFEAQVLVNSRTGYTQFVSSDTLGFPGC